MTNGIDYVQEKAFHIVNSRTCPEIFADGVSSIFVGAPLVKITFHSLLDGKTDERPELRRAQAHLTIGTVEAVQMAKAILALCKHNEDELLKNFGNISETLKLSLEGANVDVPPNFTKG